jgi:hypothetical protein
LLDAALENGGFTTLWWEAPTKMQRGASKLIITGTSHQKRKPGDMLLGRDP